MKTGFTLLELTIALLFAGIILSLVFSGFMLVNRAALFVEDTSDFDVRFSIAQNQLETDIASAFVPLQELDLTTTPTTQQNEKKEEKKQKPLTHLFHSINKAGTFAELTFISSHPLQIYEKGKTGTATPRMVRIVYRLTFDKNTQSYRLLRQEGTDLDYKKYGLEQKIRAYELIGNIKDMRIEFKAPKQPEKKDEQKSSKETVIEFETKNDWQSDQMKKKPMIPAYVNIILTLWDNLHEREKTVTFMIKIATFENVAYQLKQQQARQEKQQQQKPAMPPPSKATTATMRQQKNHVIIQKIPAKQEMKKTVQSSIPRSDTL